jgi:hypothetical protein
VNGSETREDLFHCLSRQPQVHGVWTNVDVRTPFDRSVRTEVDRIEKGVILPGCEYTPPREIGEIDLAVGSVIVSEPNPKVWQRLNLDRSSHDQSTSMMSGFTMAFRRPICQQDHLVSISDGIMALE